MLKFNKGDKLAQTYEEIKRLQEKRKELNNNYYLTTRNSIKSVVIHRGWFGKNTEIDIPYTLKEDIAEIVQEHLKTERDKIDKKIHKLGSICDEL